jgi:outer membrane receptor protein involved in Fe transport
MRLALGLDPAGTDWIDIDSFDPSFFQTSWFSADELLNNGNYLVDYYGFDHTGKRLSSKPTFEDFFTEKDQNGRFTRKVAPFEPIYISGYIQDEFTFKDLIFRVGVRVDRFDANQKVLKDPYSLFETKKAGEVTSFPGGEAVTHPSNISNEAVVYVNDINSPTAVLGYRDGDNWYDAQGTVLANGSSLRTGTGIAPYLVNPTQTVLSSGAFKDYDPQVNVMPRISFSFPISEDALFFANYDVLTQRPLNGNRLNLMDYMFIENINDVINNPDLKPETTIEYAIGFKQKLSKRSALELNAFYREMRDQITVYRVAEAYPRSYLTYRNLDFGTVKGLTLSYDMRRTNNIQFRVSYTLQFADGTGSNSTTSQNLVQAGFANLRVTQPLDFDQRHNIVVSVDYRFGADKNYNGPKTALKGGKVINWLENFGVNAIIRAGSGTPFSAQTNVTGDA